MNKRDVIAPVFVSFHAREQARARFPGFKAARIVDEVRDALRSGRISASKPPGIAPPDDPTCIYGWTEDGTRVYAIRHDPEQFVVTTTMRARAGE